MGSVEEERITTTTHPTTTPPYGADPVEGSKLGSVMISRMYKKSGEIVKAEDEDETVEVIVPVDGIPLAEVGFGCKMTMNLGNFESVSISVDIRLPCYVAEIETAYKAAKQFVDLKLNAEVDAVKTHRKAGK